MAEPEKVYLSANAYLEDTWRLAEIVRAGEWRPTVLLALWRGGAPVGVALHEYLSVTGWPLRHLPLKCASYTGIGENGGEIVFTHGELVFGQLRPGERVLVVDDVFDTGRTAAAVKAKIEATGAEMRLACVYWKPEKNTTDLKPDYFSRDVGSEWIVFPHEIDGLTQAEIRQKDPFLAASLARVRDGKGESVSEGQKA